MKKCTKCLELRKESEFHKKVTAKDGLHPNCKFCRKIISSKYYIDNKELYNSRSVEWREDNPEKAKSISKKYRSNNKDKIGFLNKKWREENKEYNSKRVKEWKKNNPGRNKGYLAKYRAAKLQRTPPWADLDAIKDFYDKCPRGYHVDHIIPLQGKNVSGLHVLENLQYLPAGDNLIKSNKINLTITKGELTCHLNKLSLTLT